MPKATVRIGLTNLLRFMSATGLTRVNSVDEALQEYSQGRDYYRELRERMVLAIKKNDIRGLETFLQNRPSDAKSPHFAICASGLIEWMAKTDYEFIGIPKSSPWQDDELRISINPEVSVRIDGTIYLVKLYLAKGWLSLPAQRAYAWLVQQTHGTRSGTPAILQVRKHRLVRSPNPSERIGRWVRGEAKAFLGYIHLDDDAA